MADDFLDLTGDNDPDTLSTSVLDLLVNKPSEPTPKVTPKVDPKPTTPTEPEEDDEVHIDDPFSEQDTSDDADESDDDPDNSEFEVVVDGKPTKVTLKDLKSRYSGETAIDARLQAATLAKKAAETESVQLSGLLKAQFDKLAVLDQTLEKLASPPIDWDKLYKENPALYLLEKEKQRDAQEKQRLVWAEGQRIQEQQAQLDSKALEKLATEEATIFKTKVPELADPKRAQALLKGMEQAAEYYGYTPEELSTAIDHRALHVLADAAKWRAAVARNKAKTTNTKPVTPRPLSRPGTVRPGPKTGMVKANQEARSEAVKSGSVDAVANMLIQRIK